MPKGPFNSLQTFNPAPGKSGQFYSLPQLEKEGLGQISKLPVSIRIVLESVLRNCDGNKINEDDIRAIAGWQPNAERTDEVPFIVARVLLQDFTGVPLLVDLAAMRSAVARLGKNTGVIEPLVPVDLVIDHSVQVDFASTKDAFEKNMQMEFKRNVSRYQFLKWGTQAFDGFAVIPPGIGICHQVNLEFLGKTVTERHDVYYPDTLVGTDSHTTMINGLGIVGWGVGGIEAEAAMLGQPVYFLVPDVIGVHMTGALRQGVTATDLVLRVTEMLRKAKVVGKFVEFHGDGASSLSVTDRATIANMAPEYGATMGFFPVDEETCLYLQATGRSEEQVAAVRSYYQAQQMFGIPKKGECEYTRVLDLELDSIVPSIAGPKRPQDRIELSNLKQEFSDLLQKPINEGGYGKSSDEIAVRYFTRIGTLDFAKTAVAGGGEQRPESVPVAAGGVNTPQNTSVWTETEMVNNRPTPDRLEEVDPEEFPHAEVDLGHGDVVIAAITSCTNTSNPSVMIAASVLSGNRNFEARVHQSVKANFLMSPPLVVAFAIAGRIDIDLAKEPLGKGSDGKDVYLNEIWPSLQDISSLMRTAFDPDTYRRLYIDFAEKNPMWNDIPTSTGDVYNWDAESTYIQEPPYFENFSNAIDDWCDVKGARPLAIFGDSVTTDHISPAGAIKPNSPAGLYLQSKGVKIEDFNSYGARRGNHEVMLRGTFANVRIKNLMVPGVEGGVTVHFADGERMSIYEAAVKYKEEGVPLVVIAGQEYGTGSSRDWAAKGTRLLGVKAVIAQSFERIHRSNLVGMGVLPCQFKEGTNAASLGLDGTETFDLMGLEEGVTPLQHLQLMIHRASGESEEIAVILRIDTPIEIDYYQHGGILPYVLRQLLAGTTDF
ncbi:MAG: aconitate hydratase [Acidobacteriota bacterium]|nr:aconitate hydratase [Acidobacteriota bacterium]